jgi:hypothetical protein
MKADAKPDDMAERMKYDIGIAVEVAFILNAKARREGKPEQLDAFIDAALEVLTLGQYTNAGGYKFSEPDRVCLEMEGSTELLNSLILNKFGEEPF